MSLAGCFVALSAQSSAAYSVSFDKILTENNLKLEVPVERWLKLQPILSDEYLQYKLVIADSDIEFRVVIEKEPVPTIWPHLEYSRILTHIASNSLGGAYILSTLSGASAHSDWHMSAEFEPKETFSIKSHGKVWSYFKEDHALITIIALYDDLDTWQDSYYNFIHF